MRGRETVEQAVARRYLLGLVQEHYADFIDFLREGMTALGFSSTEIQEDIGNWIAHGPQYLMAQAQRGQAKTTVAALYSVWYLIHNPGYTRNNEEGDGGRVVIVSAGGTQANEISTLIVRLIMTLDELECMRPDKMAGDRTATDAFDIHHSLKGLDKSPSVACFGIDSNIQGKRADILIADDVESGKNSATAVQRAKLLHITRDFTSINSSGRIIWLGTPQSIDSIYNSLPGRGVLIRIWPGRYPTEKQMETYGENLAPMIRTRLLLDPSLATGGGLAMDQGQAIDPVLLNEIKLQKKELDQGAAYFQLQHMLSTALTDATRFPLKTSNLVVLRPSMDRRDNYLVDVYPIAVTRSVDITLLRDYAVHEFGFRMMPPGMVSSDLARFQSIRAYIDPAAGGINGDETAYAIGGFLNGNITLLSVGGITGGYELAKMEALRDILWAWRPDVVTIEKNMGHGAFRAVFQPVLMPKEFPVGMHPFKCQIEDDLVGSAAKEQRIINVLSPIVGRGSLIISEECVEHDAYTTQHYSAALRLTYSFFFQFAKLTAQKDSLIHDDRVDAVAGLCNAWAEDLASDQAKAVAAAKAVAHKKLIADPLGYKAFNYSGSRPLGSSNNMLSIRRAGRRR